MDIKQRISEINQLRRQLDEEVKQLQKDCGCLNYTIGFYSWREGAFDLKRICECCSSILGNPSETEENDYYSEMLERKAKAEETGGGFTQGDGTTVYERKIEENVVEKTEDEVFKQLIPESIITTSQTIGFDFVKPVPIKPFV